MTRVRVATAVDAERIAEIHDAAVRAFGPEAYDDEQVAAWTGGDGGGSDSVEPPSEAADGEGRATPEDGDHWVGAERAGTVVGWGRIDVDEGEITGSYVHPDHARSGAGSTVIAALEGYARGTGLARVSLLASRNAVGFYERLGYEGVTAVDHESGDGVVLECREMRKTL